MPQKCDIWGLKIRGVADTLENAKSTCQRLLRIDNNYDIYTVEVGKFFPLAVEPHQIQDVEYQNSQLNQLVKGYLENRQVANDHWQQRKNEMIQEAIREGKNQEELANRPEHPIAVLQRIKNYEQSIKEIQDKLHELQEDLNRSNDKFSKYSQEERESAQKQIEAALEENLKDIDKSEQKEVDIDDIRNKMRADLGLESSEAFDMDFVLSQVKELESSLEKLQEFEKSCIGDHEAHTRITSQIADKQKTLDSLKLKLNNKDMVNSYINENYKNSQYHFD
jgi:DNA repair exonuclease SbcCD ATPase subunit